MIVIVIVVIVVLVVVVVVVVVVVIIVVAAHLLLPVLKFSASSLYLRPLSPLCIEYFDRAGCTTLTDGDHSYSPKTPAELFVRASPVIDSPCRIWSPIYCDRLLSSPFFCGYFVSGIGDVWHGADPT